MSVIHDALRRAAEADRLRRGSRPRFAPFEDPPVPGLDRLVARRPSGLLTLSVLSLLGVAVWWFLVSGPPRPDPEPGWPTATASPESLVVPPMVAEAPPGPAPAEWMPALTPAATVGLEDRTNPMGHEVSIAAAASEDPEMPPAPEVDTSEPAPAPEVPPVWKLQSIILRPGRPLAMINGKTVSEGDELDEGRVLEIGRGAVVVEWRGERLRLEPTER